MMKLPLVPIVKVFFFFVIEVWLIYNIVKFYFRITAMLTHLSVILGGSRVIQTHAKFDEQWIGWMIVMGSFSGVVYSS